MISNILTSIPLWVIPLLFGLIWLGLRASKERSVSPWLVYALPTLGLLSVTRAEGLAQFGMAAAALAAGYMIGALWGYRAQRNWIVARAAKSVRLRGEWVTMLTILTLFSLNFAAGTIQGMAPEIAASGAFAAGFGAVAGLFGGSLLGRALRVARWPILAIPAR